MKIVKMILAASIGSMLAVAPIGFVQANDAHHPATDSITKQTQPKKKISTKKIQTSQSKQSGQMAMGGMMTHCPMMQGGQAGQGKMMKDKKMKCPMMSADGASMPGHSLRMQWYHNMMMWHHQMMHSPSSMHRGG